MPLSLDFGPLDSIPTFDARLSPWQLEEAAPLMPIEHPGGVLSAWRARSDSDDTVKRVIDWGYAPEAEEHLRIGISYADEATRTTDYLKDRFIGDLETGGMALGEIDTLIGTGLSGSLVVPRLAESLGLRWAVVRKENDGAHDSRKVVGDIGKRWMFVDDFISTGQTYHRVLYNVAQITDVRGHDTDHIGVWEYGNADAHRADDEGLYRRFQRGDDLSAIERR